MKIYKDHSYLVFDFEENGRVVKYNFATKEAYGLNGKKVKSLNNQLKGYSIDGLFDSFVDQQYAKFLKWITYRSQYPISNIGTILSRVPMYANTEQIFSAGFSRVSGKFNHTINEIPKAFREICIKYNLELSEKSLKSYINLSDAWQLAYRSEFISLNEKDIFVILMYETDYYSRGHYDTMPRFQYLVQVYGYNPKYLLNYIDRLKTYEAITDMSALMRELQDYCKMMSDISPKYDKYPRHFLTTHRIAARNYTRLKKEFDEKHFKECINTEMEKNIGDYTFIYPKSTQEIKDEAVQMNNCVASYIDKVLERRCDILFMRYKDSPCRSLVTIEVANGKIVQALQKFNDPLTAEQADVVEKWNRWYENKLKSEVIKNAS